MNADLRTCPYSPFHRVYGGYPEYVCPDCAIEWVIVGGRGHTSILYTHFDANGNVLRRWKVPLADGELKARRRRSA